MKVLIVTNQIESITRILNFMTLNINNKISILIANNVKAAKKIISENNIQLVICEANIFNSNFYKEILNCFAIVLINSNYAYKEIPSKHLYYVSLDSLNNLQRIIYKYISSYSILENTKADILNELIQLGFNVKHNGTQYIAECILLIKFYSKTKNIKDLYSIIAEKYNTTISNIKSNILNSINYMYFESDFSKLKTYFSLAEDIKPTPKQIILTILENV